MTAFGLSGLILTTSFAAGVVSFLSPCVLPLVPGYLSYVAGETVASPSRRHGGAILRASLPFVLGFSTVFVAMGASATGIGRLLLAYRSETNLLGGAIVILFGLSMMGLARFGWLERDLRFHLDLPGGRPLAAYILGLAFAFGWTPCIGPVLGTILTMSATRATIGQGIALLSLYSLGLGLPFLAAALFTDGLLRRLRLFGRIGRGVQLGAGAVVALVGIAIVTGELSAFSYWLLDTFPILARVG
ncbi:MAG TPA: cytochrome c biogenesis protein CcdA [Stellaceae bacterium]|nr:cytochrome c biogenesis protein CcdA [Stellaceae bacterium]